MVLQETTFNLEQLLRWYLEVGVDEMIGEQPLDHYTNDSTFLTPVTEVNKIVTKQTNNNSSTQLATASKTLESLKMAIESYDGCKLKNTCRNLVFASGNPKADLMLIGEAPGAEEDIQGIPFVGASGRLLECILKSIRLHRKDVYITNLIPWRPPGNCKPDLITIELCLPFIIRHIELVTPRIIVFLGGTSANALLYKHDAISKMRGKWYNYKSTGLINSIVAMPTYHPSYLLRTPQHKRETWHDFLSIRKKLDNLDN
ncbi:MAG: uracil-DNA glycosylase [Rhodospirillaceae bacterium]|jgi:DNA polymerase|nr:uracil-DNA glycosylase [Rhodospirillaceae bacterium]